MLIPTTQTLLAVVFIGLAAASGVALALATNNYLEFFPALERISVRIASVEVITQDQLYEITILFVLDNPTGYNGLGLRSFQSSLKFLYPNGTTINYGPGPGQTGAIIQIVARSSMNIPRYVPMDTDLWGGIPQDFVEGRAEAELSVLVGLSTFLDSMSWIILSFECVLGTPPVDCARGPATAVSPSGVGGL